MLSSVIATLYPPPIFGVPHIFYESTPELKGFTANTANPESLQI